MKGAILYVMKTTGFVYKWTNNINGKWYIGSHKGTMADGYRHSSKVMESAERKYGKDNFIRTIIYQGKNFRETEAKYLHKYDAANNPMSYNRSNLSGANSHTKLTRSKISEGLSGKPKSESHKQSLRAAWDQRGRGENYDTIYGMEKSREIRKKISRPGKTNSFYQKEHTQETKDLISSKLSTPAIKIARSKRMLGDKNPAKRPEVRLQISITGKGRVPWNKGSFQNQIKCPYCNKTGGQSVMKRWHFSRCRHKK